MKNPVPWYAPGEREQRVEKQCLQAFLDTTGMELEAFDQAWASWVRENYPR